MNKNIENYKKAINKIEASEKLKERSWEKMENNEKNIKINLRQVVAICASFVVVVLAGTLIFNNTNMKKNNEENGAPLLAEVELPRLKDIDQLKEILEKNSNSRRNIVYNTTMSVEESVDDVAVPQGQTSGASNSNNTLSSSNNYSKTNVQVENVDEADIVKTDGKYIYYVNSGKVLIVDSEKLEKLAEITIEKKSNYYSYSNVSEIFMIDNKVILLGTENVYEVPETKEKDPTVRQYGGNSVENTTVVNRKTYPMTVARVYDISDKKNPKLERRVGIEGYYQTARMIDNNVYLIANKSIYYYKSSDIKDDELLPRVLDTAKSEVVSKRAVTDIAYIEECNSFSYLMVAGFNINNKNEATFETVLGAGDEVYASEKNLYVTDSIYNYGILINEYKSKIFKFALNDGKISFIAQGEVPGGVHDQFSMDEYNGYLRVATTGENILGGDTNNLIVLDEKLQKVGEINGIAVGEQIKSVRFVGKVGYIVTFERIDPLFVVDLSDPKNPTLRGELKIPGYSAYLHPYDETHIIGIGQNTETTNYGNTINTNMKMSMFDVSDLDNPKEIFNVEIGEESANSSITYDHKALFYYKEKNLIGFPVSTYDKTRESGFEIYQIDLAGKQFKKYGELKKSGSYWNNVRRIIYIGNNLYSLTAEDITKYDLETAEEKGSLTINSRNTEPVIIYDDFINTAE